MLAKNIMTKYFACVWNVPLIPFTPLKGAKGINTSEQFPLILILSFEFHFMPSATDQFLFGWPSPVVFMPYPHSRRRPTWPHYMYMYHAVFFSLKCSFSVLYCTYRAWAYFIFIIIHVFFFSGTVHIYSICRHLMACGHSSKVTSYQLSYPTNIDIVHKWVTDQLWG